MTLLVYCICLELRGVKKAGSDQASGGCSLGIQDGPRGREELFLEVRAKNVCG